MNPNRTVGLYSTSFEMLNINYIYLSKFILGLHRRVPRHKSYIIGASYGVDPSYLYHKS